MTSKLLPTPTEISLVRLPNTFCIPPAFWILTILNKDERKDCVRMGKKKVRKIDVCLFVIMKTNIEMVFLLELYPCMLFKTDHAVRNRRMQLHRSAQTSQFRI